MFEKIQHSRILFIGLIIVVVIFGVFKTYYTELKDRESIINELDKTFDLLMEVLIQLPSTITLKLLLLFGEVIPVQ